MLKDELPKIVTDAVPGPKAAAVLARRAKAIPSAIRTIYPVVMDKAQGATLICYELEPVTRHNQDTSCRRYALNINQ